MAGILAISSCNMAGGMVYAEEVSQENVVEGENTEETFTGISCCRGKKEQENEEVEEATRYRQKETTVEEGDRGKQQNPQPKKQPARMRLHRRKQHRKPQKRSQRKSQREEMTPGLQRKSL